MTPKIEKDVIAFRERRLKKRNYWCFWSSPDNERGLQLTPIIEPGRLYLDLKIELYHSGFPGIANGGVSFTILDGMMSWYIMSHLGRAGFTKSCTIDYYQPLHVGKTYRFEVIAAPEEAIASGQFNLVGHAFAKNSEGVISNAKPLLKMTGTFMLPNRELARRVLQVEFDQESEQMFPE